MRHISVCPKCRTYSMKDECSCGEKNVDPKPPKYSPDDKYWDIKRKAKEEEYRLRGLLG